MKLFYTYEDMSIPHDEIFLIRKGDEGRALLWWDGTHWVDNLLRAKPYTSHSIPSMFAFPSRGITVSLNWAQKAYATLHPEVKLSLTRRT